MRVLRDQIPGDPFTLLYPLTLCIVEGNEHLRMRLTLALPRCAHMHAKPHCIVSYSSNHVLNSEALKSEHTDRHANQKPFAVF